VGDVLRQCRDGIVKICRLLDVAKLLHWTMNAILAKTIDEHQRDWDSQLHIAMTAYTASRDEGTDYSLNFLVLGCEAHVLMDLMYGAPDEGNESFDIIVEVDTFTEVSKTFRRSVECNRRYTGLSVKAKTSEAGQPVWHYSLRVIQRSARLCPNAVHVDKLKGFKGTPSSSWLDNRTASDEGNSPSSTPLITVGTSPESEVSPTKADEGWSAGIAEDSFAEGLFPKHLMRCFS